jgi:hypothetical protein
LTSQDPICPWHAPDLLRQKRYLISTPWEQGLPGRLTVCTREEIVDGMLGVGTGTVQRIKAEMSA